MCTRGGAFERRLTTRPHGESEKKPTRQARERSRWDATGQEAEEHDAGQASRVGHVGLIDAVSERSPRATSFVPAQRRCIGEDRGTNRSSVNSPGDRRALLVATRRGRPRPARSR